MSELYCNRLLAQTHRRRRRASVSDLKAAGWEVTVFERETVTRRVWYVIVALLMLWDSDLVRLGSVIRGCRQSLHILLLVHLWRISLLLLMLDMTGWEIETIYHTYCTLSGSRSGGRGKGFNRALGLIRLQPNILRHVDWLITGSFGCLQ